MKQQNLSLLHLMSFHDIKVDALHVPGVMSVTGPMLYTDMIISNSYVADIAQNPETRLYYSLAIAAADKSKKRWQQTSWKRHNLAQPQPHIRTSRIFTQGMLVVMHD
jgi:hypothetical protein